MRFGGITLLVTKTNPQIVPNGVVFKSGMVAAIAIFGIAWMSDTYFQYAMPQFKAGIDMEAYPWTLFLHYLPFQLLLIAKRQQRSDVTCWN